MQILFIIGESELIGLFKLGGSSIQVGESENVIRLLVMDKAVITSHRCLCLCLCIGLFSVPLSKVRECDHIMDKISFQCNFLFWGLKIKMWSTSLAIQLGKPSKKNPDILRSGRGPSHQFFGQISARNLSKIPYVWVKVWTKHAQKSAYSRQNLIRDKGA